jgi:NAD(P)-dependent dehydrogenase (short-subunit alcohol dehydrogenase family)
MDSTKFYFCSKTNSDLFSLKDRVIILTGAAGKLGPSYAAALSEAGAHIILADLKTEDCLKLADMLAKKYGTNSLGVHVDLTNEDSVDAMVGNAMNKYSRIDGLINNAAYEQHASQMSYSPATALSFENYPLELWEKTIAVNLTGTFLCTQAVGKVMVAQGRGVILNISSIYGMVGADQRIYGNSGINSTVAYAVTKSGLINFTRFLAAHWKEKNIRVNSLSPGGVFDNQDPDFVKNYCDRNMIGRMATQEDLCGAVLFLMSDAAAYITGANLVVDGGWTAW